MGHPKADRAAPTVAGRGLLPQAVAGADGRAAVQGGAGIGVELGVDGARAHLVRRILEKIMLIRVSFPYYCFFLDRSNNLYTFTFFKKGAACMERKKNARVVFS